MKELMKNVSELLIQWHATKIRLKEDPGQLTYDKTLSKEQQDALLMNSIQARLGKSKQDQQLIDDL
jgi:hypothetical protein